MASDGYFTFTVPNISNQISSDVDEMRENFEYLRRLIMAIEMPFVANTTVVYTYSSNLLVKSSYTGGLTGEASYTWDTTTLEIQRVKFDFYSKSIAFDYTWSGGKITQMKSSIS